MRGSIYPLLLSCLLFIFQPAYAEEEKPESSSIYYEISQDIVTNYINTDKTLGYVRVHITLMLNHEQLNPVVQHHLPLIRDTIIYTIGQQSNQKIKSVEGREEVRVACEQAVNQILAEVIGEPPIRQLLFTTYVYQ